MINESRPFETMRRGLAEAAARPDTGPRHLNPRPTSRPVETALALRAQLDQDELIDAAACARTSAEYELFAALNAEEQSAIRNLLCPPTLTLSDPSATVLELTAAEQVVELCWALLRARRLYLDVLGAGR